MTARIALKSLMVLAALVGATGRADACDQVVFPSGLGVDAANIQCAVDLGGTVTLKATDVDGVPRSFELGSSSIALTRDVLVEGERVDGHRARIVGGRNVFSYVVPTDPSIQPTGTFTIRRIDFDGPTQRVIFFQGAASATIEDNRMTNFQGPLNVGIVILNSTGLVSILDNDIQGLSATAISFGVTTSGSTGDVRIVNNVIGDPANPAAGPHTWAMAMGPAGGSTTIMHNKMFVGPSSTGFGRGFGVRFFIAAVPVGPVDLAIAGNEVTVTHRDATALRVANPGGHTAIFLNDIRLQGAIDQASVDEASSLFWNLGAIVVNTTDGATVAFNRVTGQAFCGVCFYGSSNGTILYNNLDGLTVPPLSQPLNGTDSADYVFGTFEMPDGVIEFADDNLVLGAAADATVFDDGEGNRVFKKRR